MENDLFKDYVRIPKPQAFHHEPDPNINIKSTGSTKKYIAYGAKLLINEKFPKISLTASGNAVNKALITADILRKKIKGLSQINEIKSKEVEDEFQAKNSDQSKIKIMKNLAILEIILSNENNLDESHYGYQPPLSIEKIKEFGTTFLPKEEKKEKNIKTKKLKKFINKKKKVGNNPNSPSSIDPSNSKLYLIKNKNIKKQQHS